MIKGSVQQENITFRGIYAPNKGAPEYVKQNINRHKERNSNTITVGELYTLLTSIDKSSRQKMNRETLWTVICHQIGQPRRNGYIPRNIQSSKTSKTLFPGRNRKSEQINH